MDSMAPPGPLLDDKICSKEEEEDLELRILTRRLQLVKSQRQVAAEHCRNFARDLEKHITAMHLGDVCNPITGIEPHHHQHQQQLQQQQLISGQPHLPRSKLLPQTRSLSHSGQAPAAEASKKVSHVRQMSCPSTMNLEAPEYNKELLGKEASSAANASGVPTAARRRRSRQRRQSYIAFSDPLLSATTLKAKGIPGERGTESGLSRMQASSKMAPDVPLPLPSQGRYLRSNEYANTTGMHARQVSSEYANTGMHVHHVSLEEGAIPPRLLSRDLSDPYYSLDPPSPLSVPSHQHWRRSSSTHGTPVVPPTQTQGLVQSRSIRGKGGERGLARGSPVKCLLDLEEVEVGLDERYPRGRLLLGKGVLRDEEQLLEALEVQEEGGGEEEVEGDATSLPTCSAQKGNLLTRRWPGKDLQLGQLEVAGPYGNKEQRYQPKEQRYELEMEGLDGSKEQRYQVKEQRYELEMEGLDGNKEQRYQLGDRRYQLEVAGLDGNKEQPYLLKEQRYQLKEQLRQLEVTGLDGNKEQSYQVESIAFGQERWPRTQSEPVYCPDQSGLAFYPGQCEPVFCPGRSTVQQPGQHTQLSLNPILSPISPTDSSPYGQPKRFEVTASLSTNDSLPSSTSPFTPAGRPPLVPSGYGSRLPRVKSYQNQLQLWRSPRGSQHQPLPSSPPAVSPRYTLQSSSPKTPHARNLLSSRGSPRTPRTPPSSFPGSQYGQGGTLERRKEEYCHTGTASTQPSLHALLSPSKPPLSPRPKESTPAHGVPGGFPLQGPQRQQKGLGGFQSDIQRKRQHPQASSDPHTLLACLRREHQLGIALDPLLCNALSQSSLESSSTGSFKVHSPFSGDSAFTGSMRFSGHFDSDISPSPRSSSGDMYAFASHAQEWRPIGFDDPIDFAFGKAEPSGHTLLANSTIIPH